jgi:hypothetical protein
MSVYNLYSCGERNNFCNEEPGSRATAIEEILVPARSKLSFLSVVPKFSSFCFIC